MKIEPRAKFIDWLAIYKIFAYKFTCTIMLFVLKSLSNSIVRDKTCAAIHVSVSSNKH